MYERNRNELEQEVVDALIESKAIDFEAVASLVAQFGARAAQSGSEFGVVVNWRTMDVCIPPDPYRLAVDILAAQGRA
ncbi:MAG: hypothetical protein QOK39_2238 [Acidimicrobiaceae bacterium]|jgi:hypothetical protein|nr:hypothetical protein [Acidimicrobiaceae bacterium]